MLYVLKFSQPLGTTGRNSAQYYVGFAEDGRVAERIAEHRTGRGAAITAYAVSQGITLELVALTPGDRKAERRIKRNGHFEQQVQRWTTSGRNLLVKSLMWNPLVGQAVLA